MDKRTKRVVGNCPRCGMPIYEAKGEPKKSCRCAPLADAPVPWVPAPYVPTPVYPRRPWYPWWYPWNPYPLTPYYSTWGGTANVPSVWVGDPTTAGSVTVTTTTEGEPHTTTVCYPPSFPHSSTPT